MANDQRRKSCHPSYAFKNLHVIAKLLQKASMFQFDKKSMHDGQVIYSKLICEDNDNFALYGLFDEF